MHLSLSYLVRGVTNTVLLANGLCQKSTDLPAYLQSWLITSYITSYMETFKNNGIEHFFIIIYAAALVTYRFFAVCPIFIDKFGV